MNTKILAALIAVALITGCASLNKASNTPDDTYYTPATAAKTSSSANDAGYDQYENYQSNNDDQYLRMKVQNQSLWGSLDDYSYWNDSRYDYGYSCDPSRDMLLSPIFMSYGYGYGLGMYGLGLGYGMGYGGFGFGYGYGSWASPYQTVVMYRNPKVYFAGSKSNLTAYRNIQYSNYNNPKYTTATQSGSNYTTRGGSFNNNSYTPSRSFSTGSATNSAGGRSGGFSSAGSSAGGARASRH